LKPDLTFAAPGAVPVATALRAQLPDRTWSQIKRLCSAGKVTVDGALVTDPALRLTAGQTVTLRMNAPVLKAPAPVGFRVVFEDGHLVVIEKPSGVSSVPYERKETGTALDLIRAEWRKSGRKATVTPLYTVHRIDKDTSGLLVFAKTRLAERGLHWTFQKHLADREYVAVVHGRVTPGRIESRLVPDRGDGLRGSTRRDTGQQAVTHVVSVESLARATLCRIRLETGRTHQIRIHLAEGGHPLVGETVYIRDHLRLGRPLLPSPRLLLHAATLGFDHPVTHERLQFSANLPDDFVSIVESLRK
jgi:23S rRNA pseudouridine1911/1915/1917 synthase